MVDAPVDRWSHRGHNGRSSAFIGSWTLVALLCASMVVAISAESSAPSAPTDVSAYATEDAIHVKWRAPPDMVRGFSVGFGYGPEPYQEIPMSDPSVTTYSIDGPFDPGREYIIYVMAFNDKGFSEKAYTAVRVPSSTADNVGGESYDVVALEAPFNLKSQTVSSTEVRLSWDDFDGGGAADKSYTVRYGAFPVQYDAQGKGNFSEISTKDHIDVAIKDLKPSTKYEFSVRYTLPNGENSDWSLSTTAETDKDAPTSPPLITKFVSIDPQSVYISWKPPVEPNAPLTGYELFHISNEETTDLTKWTRVNLGSGDRSYTLQNLPIGRVYVQVRAVNAFGPGPFSPANSEQTRAPNEERSTTTRGTLSPDLHPASGTDKSPLWISPKDRQIEKTINDMLSVPCSSRSGHLVKNIAWAYPNGTHLPFNKGKTRVYAEKATQPHTVRLIFSKLQYADSGQYHCVGVVNDRTVRESITLRVLYTPTSSRGEMLKCDFELASLCGWSPDAASSLQWHWAEAGHNLRGRFAMVLPRDHSTIKTPRADNGHYVYLQGLDKDKGFGRLTSPAYTAGFSLQSCFSVWYHAGPSSSGKLKVYMIPIQNGAMRTENTSLLQTIDLKRNRGTWQNARIPLKAHKDEFKIIIEAIKEHENLTVAIDDVELLTGGCPEIAKQGDHARDDEVEVDLLRAIRRPFQDAFIENVRGVDGLPGYNFRRGSYIVVPYRYHMPRKFFKDFAVLVTANPSDDEGGYLFAVVNPFDTVVELGLLVDSSAPVPAGQTNLTLFYTDHKKEMVSKPLASFLIPRIVGRWTQFAVKVDGNAVTLFLNCQRYKTVSVNRRPKQLQFDEASKLYIAQAGPLLRKEYAGGIQELKIFASPNEADNQCSLENVEGSGTDDMTGDGVRPVDGQTQPAVHTLPPPMITSPPPEFPVSRGEKGERGEPGPAGPRGESIRGESGPKGDRGDIGMPGPLGPPGTCSCDERPSSQYARQGPPGMPGQPGADGAKGERGEPGAPGGGIDSLDLSRYRGEKGEPGPPGLPAPAGGLQPGDVNYIPGPKGDRGPPGPSGPPGPRGDFGPPGVRGPPGRKGERGDDGFGRAAAAWPPGSAVQRGLPGERGPPGPRGLPGPPGPLGAPGSISNVVPGADYTSRGEKGQKGEAGVGLPGPPGPPGAGYGAKVPIDGPQVVPGAVVYHTNLDLFHAAKRAPVGTIAFSLSSQQLYVRVQDGWRQIKLEGFHRALDYDKTSNVLADETAGQALRSKPAALESVVVTLPQEASTWPPTRLPPLDIKYPTDEVLHLIALNKPFSGNMNGVRGADLECYHQARMAGFRTTFRAFISSQVQDLDKIVHFGDRRTPVTNLAGDVLFNSWEDLFHDNGAQFPENVPVYSFDRRDVLRDSNWPNKYVWHGSDTKGVRRDGKFCNAWRSASPKDRGMASPLDKRFLLAQQDFNCDDQFVVLCVENMSQRNVLKRMNLKRNVKEPAEKTQNDEAAAVALQDLRDGGS